MKRVGRRGFAKSMGIAAAFAPVLLGADAVPTRAPQTSQADGSLGRAEGMGLTAEQQSKLIDAIARRGLQWAQLHERALPYDLEPAFVFRARVAPPAGRKP